MSIVFSSSDGGFNWAPVEVAGVPSGLSVASIAVSDDGNTMYLATPAGLYKGPGH